MNARTLLDATFPSAENAFMSLRNSRFIFDPHDGRMHFGGNDPSEGSHANDYGELTGGKAGTRFDECVRGWVGGKARGYPFGVIHFAPPIQAMEQFDAALLALKHFIGMGAASKTVLRGFHGAWEQPLGAAVPEFFPQRKRPRFESRPEVDLLTLGKALEDEYGLPNRFWVDPGGKIIALPPLIGPPDPNVARTHEDWAAKQTGVQPRRGESNASETLYAKGWLRGTMYGSDSVMLNTSQGRRCAPRQQKSVVDGAMMRGLDKVYFDNGNSYNVLWASHEGM